MRIDFLPDKPIYQQLIERITGSVIRGELRPGEKLPSVREYAVQVGVNANTMQRVFRELEQMGITETRRGQGSFVTEDEGKINEVRHDMKEQLTHSFLQNIAALGFSSDEMISHLQERSEKND